MRLTIESMFIKTSRKLRPGPGGWGEKLKSLKEKKKDYKREKRLNIQNVKKENFKKERMVNSIKRFK